LKNFFKNNGILLLIIALLLGALVAVASILLGGTANPLSNAIGFITTPIRNGTTAVASWAEGLYNYSFQYDALREENEALKAKIAELEELAREGEADSKENVRLRQLLGLREKRRDFTFESASVTARSTTNWENTLTLSKGSNHGVEHGDCVVDAAHNLVGVVSEVGLNYCVMTTVIDSGFRMGGFLSRTDEAAILEGDFTLMGEGKLKLTYLPENVELLAGDLVLTSGLGGTYPAGLVVGTIESVQTDPSGMTRHAVVVPSTTLSEQVQVFIIKDFDLVE